MRVIQVEKHSQQATMIFGRVVEEEEEVYNRFGDYNPFCFSNYYVRSNHERASYKGHLEASKAVSENFNDMFVMGCFTQDTSFFENV